MALTSFDPAARQATIDAHKFAYLANGGRIHEVAPGVSGEADTRNKPAVIHADSVIAKEIVRIVMSVRATSKEIKSKTSLYETVGKQYGRDRTTIARIFKAYNSKVPE